jgi:hypothetical protein
VAGCDGFSRIRTLARQVLITDKRADFDVRVHFCTSGSIRVGMRSTYCSSVSTRRRSFGKSASTEARWSLGDPGYLHRHAALPSLLVERAATAMHSSETPSPASPVAATRSATAASIAQDSEHDTISEILVSIGRAFGIGQAMRGATGCHPHATHPKGCCVAHRQRTRPTDCTNPFIPAVMC